MVTIRLVGTGAAPASPITLSPVTRIEQTWQKRRPKYTPAARKATGTRKPITFEDGRLLHVITIEAFLADDAAANALDDAGANWWTYGATTLEYDLAHESQASIEVVWQGVEVAEEADLQGRYMAIVALADADGGVKSLP